MRPAPILAVERFRVRTGPLASSRADGNNGAFHIPLRDSRLVVVASDGLGWEHVSVSLRDRTPTWDEMCHVKDLFWSEEETVVQYHPARSAYRNHHEFCLHLWRPIEASFPLPDPFLVAPGNAEEFARLERLVAEGAR